MSSRGGLALADLEQQPVDLVGLGIDICALIPRISKLAGPVRAYLDNPDDLSADETRICSKHKVVVKAVSSWTDPAPIAVRAPGFPRYREDIAPVLDRVKVTTPIDLWLNTLGPDHPTVLVTGTKGKSTVTTMIKALLGRSEMAGNIGMPIWSLLNIKKGRPVICEVSSYQAADIDAVVDLAVLTSLSEDHVSWHGSVERYHADKLGPVNQARRVLTHPEFIGALSTRAGEVRTVEPLHTDGLTMPSHMAANAELAIAAALWVKEIYPGVQISADPVAVLNKLPALPGRLRPVISEYDEHHWFDDSLASNPSGAAAAVRAFLGKPIYLIVGGIDRNVSLDPLIAAVKEAMAAHSAFSIATLPDNGMMIAEQLVHACGDFVQIIEAKTVAEAVESARIFSDQSTVVLFSPAAPTPARFGNWADRSAEFVTAVKGGAPFN
ncbi:MAG: hypothetical protein HKN03_16335 [Acidimicrobiales bacterium]|nr:hypothetical protein [Acidimicrobiales bacterium]